jgi:signal transduction histidine kinase
MISAAALLALPLLALGMGDQSPAPKRVFILYDENPNLTGLASTDRSLVSTLRQLAEGRVDIYTEFMDVSRFSDGDAKRFEQRLQQLYHEKYAGRKMDLVIGCMGPAFDFLLRHRAELFPSIPMVFCGVDRRELQGRELGSDVTGVTLRREFRPTLELALKLHPRTRNVYVIAGSSPFNQYWLGQAREDLIAAAPRVSISYLSDLTMAEIERRVANLPPRSLVLFLHVFMDAAGTVFNPYDSLSRVTRASNAPVYVFLDSYVGSGAVGGAVYSFEAQGTTAGELAWRILSGVPPSTLAVAELGSSVGMFDWRQIRRWDIPESALPPRAVVRFREPSFWDLYRWHLLVGFLIIAAQTALIVALLIQRQRRRVAENELRARREELAHASRVSSLGELSASLAHELNQPLTAILSNAQAARRLMANGTARDTEEVRAILEDIIHDDRLAEEIIERMRALARKQRVEPESVDIAEALREILPLVHADAVRRNVRIVLDIAPALPKVRGNKVQLQQVALNLILNALDAVKDAAVADREVQIRAYREGAAVNVEVRDRGTGIPAAALGRIFQPFYTTKPQGLGIGLSISRAIMEAHGGRLWLKSTPARQGTVFVFSLPAVEPELQHGTPRGRNHSRQLMSRLSGSALLHP